DGRHQQLVGAVVRERAEVPRRTRVLGRQADHRLPGPALRCAGTGHEQGSLLRDRPNRSRPPILRSMHQVEVKRQMGKGDIAAVSELLDLATEADDHRPLGEHQWLDLVQGGREGFAGLVAWEPGHEHPVGYAQVTRGPDSWALEFVV